jgi:hypothetical protein
MQLDEYKEKYKAIARSTNIKAQLKRAQMLEYNMSQMEDSQRRVRALLHDCSGLMLILHPFQLVHQNTQARAQCRRAETVGTSRAHNQLGRARWRLRGAEVKRR